MASTPQAGYGTQTGTQSPPMKKESFLTKLKEKLPGQHKMTDNSADTMSPASPQKKSLLDKIKEKLPTSH